MRDERDDDSRSMPLAEDLAAARAQLRELLEQADVVAESMADGVEHARRTYDADLARERDEIDEIRAAMLERLEAANERFGAAERVVEASRARLAEIDRLHQETQREADALLADARAEARRITERAITHQRDAERHAASLIEHAEVTAAGAVDRITQTRHAEIDDLHEREREIKARIEQLLADGVSVSSLGVTPSRRTEAHVPVIDLTDGVDDAIRGVIGQWSARRSPH